VPAPVRAASDGVLLECQLQKCRLPDRTST
jgi:hypothetical protein